MTEHVTVCRGCYAELVELRQMVLHELPIVEEAYEGAYVAVNVKDLRLLQGFARQIRLCDK